ncbi:MAG: hypothetical protein H6822_07410 [Planctomycetaceae bacterium]|nr:hypothetical protein [Planctomycetaceae bacterium]
MSRQHWILRLIALVLVVLVAGSAIPVVSSGFRSWNAWRFTTKYYAFIALLTIASATIFRLHGWRLCRPLNEPL